jgi:hypothetical protein
MDQNLEKLISIGDACMRSQYYSPSTILYCTTEDSLTVQDLVDLKRFRAAENVEAGRTDSQQPQVETVDDKE